MTNNDKIKELAAKCREAVVPLIDRDYYLLGLPYHNNIGDILIWEGERSLLKTLPHKCLGVCGWASYPAEPLADKNALVLIHGGGYMGDVWRKGWETVLDFMRLNPENKIVVLPNTLHYADPTLAAADREIMERCKDLTLCMRDSRSLALAREYFPNTPSILVPDMAFCITPERLARYTKNASLPTLLLKRLDKEIGSTPIPDSIMALQPDVRDWPPMEHRALTGQFLFPERLFNFVNDKVIRLQRRGLMPAGATDWLYKVWFRPMLLRMGTSFVSQYHKIYTTRLHVMILSVILGREVWLIDNSYGKLSSFYETWLHDCQTVNYCKS